MDWYGGAPPPIPRASINVANSRPTTHTNILQSPCAKAIYYAPTSFMFTGWSLTFSLMEFSMGAPLLGTVRLGNALVTGLLIGACLCCVVCTWGERDADNRDEHTYHQPFACNPP